MELSQRNWRRNGNQTALEEESVGEGEGGGGGQRLQKWEKRVTKDIKDSSHSIYSIIWCCWPFCMAPNAPLFCYHSTAYWLRSSADGFAPPPGSPGSPGSPDRIPGQDLWEWMADLWLSWLRKRIKISICDRFWMEWDGMESLISSAIAPLNGVNKRWKLAIFGWLWLNGFLIGSTLNSITEWERGKIWGERERERKKRASRVFYKRPTHPIHPASQPAIQPFTPHSMLRENTRVPLFHGACSASAAQIPISDTWTLLKPPSTTNLAIFIRKFAFYRPDLTEIRCWQPALGAKGCSAHSRGSAGFFTCIYNNWMGQWSAAAAAAAAAPPPPPPPPPPPALYQLLCIEVVKSRFGNLHNGQYNQNISQKMISQNEC